MARRQYPLEITVRDRQKERTLFVGVRRGIFKRQLVIVSVEKDGRQTVRREALSSATGLKKALARKIDRYLTEQT